MDRLIKAGTDLSDGRAAVASRPDRVRVDVWGGPDHAVALFCPDEARALAAALLRAADEAEGTSAPRNGTWHHAPAGPEATRRTAANLDGRRPENQEDAEH